ncbi:hypothetical protein XANCAGTX0491_009337 [Xanthoria calcicola]
MDLQTTSNIDRRQCKRVVPMRCLVLGLGRTGTNSICQAMEILGFDETYHMSKVVSNLSDNDIWLDAINAKAKGEKPFGREQWDQLLGHCQAVTDFPAALFAPELIAAYPEAKVVLSNRDVDQWYRSIIRTIDWRYRDPVHFLLSLVDPPTGKWARMFYKMWSLFAKGDFARHGKDAFHEHYQRVRELVPPDRLLEYRVSEGWEPLCRFLDLEIPDRPFPAGNEQESFRQTFRALDRERALAVLRKTLPWLFGLGIAVLSMVMTFRVRSTA